MKAGILIFFVVSAISAVDVPFGSTIGLNCHIAEADFGQINSFKWSAYPEGSLLLYLIFYRELQGYFVDQSIDYMFGKVSSTGGVRGSRNMNLIIQNISTDSMGKYNCEYRTTLGRVIRPEKYIISEYNNSVRIELEDPHVNSNDNGTGVEVYYYHHVQNPIVITEPGHVENAIPPSLYVYLTIGIICTLASCVYCAIILHMIYKKRKSHLAEISSETESIPLQ